MRENIKKGVFVDGLIEQAVNNAAEAYNVSLMIVFSIFSFILQLGAINIVPNIN